MTLTTNRDRLSLRLHKKNGETFIAVVGDNDGRIWPSKSSKGYVYIRELLSVDSSGNQTYGEPYLVRDIGSDFVPYRNAQVRVRWDDFDQEWELERPVHSDLIANNINPAIFNAANPYANQPDMDAFLPLKSFAVATSNTDTTEVGVNNFIYRDTLGDLKLFAMSGFNRPDLSDYAPSSGEHRLVHLWLLTDNTVTVSTSTAKGEAVPFTLETDLAECLENPPNQLAIPIGAWKITGDAVTITDNDLYQDTRGWLNTPHMNNGLPISFDKDYLVRTNTQVISHGEITIEAGTTFTIEADGEHVVLADGMIETIVTVTGDYTQTGEEDVIICNPSANMTLTLLPLASAPVNRLYIKNISTYTITIDGDGSETIDGATTQSLVQWESLTLIPHSEWSIL